MNEKDVQRGIWSPGCVVTGVVVGSQVHSLVLDRRKEIMIKLDGGGQKPLEIEREVVD